MTSKLNYSTQLPPYEPTCRMLTLAGRPPGYGRLTLVFAPIVISGLTYFMYRVTRVLVRYAVDTPIGKELMTDFLSMCKKWTKQPNVPSDAIRTTFNSIPRVHVPQSVRKEHTHPLSAKIRNSSSLVADIAAGLMGKIPYYLQKSRYDERLGRAGCRSYHWARDMTVVSERFNPPEDSVLTLVDVDQYMDMPNLMALGNHPLLVSTFQPRAVSKSKGEYSYTFNENSEVVYTVSGGAKYVHNVWNYGSDTLTATTARYWGLWHVMTTYNVDKKYLDDDHELILLTPMVRLITPFFSLAQFLGHHILDRFSLVDGEFLRLSAKTGDSMLVSTGKVNAYVCATIPVEQDDTLSSLVAINKTDLSPALVKTTIGTDDPTIATVLTEYHRYKSKRVVDIAYPSAQAVKNYQFDPKQYDPDSKVSVIPFMDPILEGCFAPTKNKSNDERAVQGRIKDVANTQTLTPFLLQCICEFAEFIVPESILHRAVPVDLSVVQDKQSRPSQRVILNLASMQVSTVDIKPLGTFQKSETYDEPKDPRIITTFPGVTKMNYSRYIYAFSERMRELDWYAFGKSPALISERVVDVVSNAKSATMSDLSRCDGRVSNVARILDQIILLRYFSKYYHAELVTLMLAQYNATAYTSNGVKYDTGTAQSSGGADTADMNSVLNACMAYTSKRRHLAPQEAWQGLGIYGGDDGLTADMDNDSYTKTCAMFGQKLEADLVLRGAFGVNFLARYYSPEVWHGSHDSMCDLRRQLLKLHVTVSMPSNVTPLEKLGEKMLAFSLMDENTPVIGAMVKTFVKHYSAYMPQKCVLGIANWYAIYDRIDQFPNQNENGWMENYMLKYMPLFDCAMFSNWLDKVASGQCSILNPPCCEPLANTTVKPKHDVVINGDIHRGSANDNVKKNSDFKSSLSNSSSTKSQVDSNEVSYSETTSNYSPSSPVCTRNHKHDHTHCIYTQPFTVRIPSVSRSVLATLYNTSNKEHLDVLEDWFNEVNVDAPVQQPRPVYPKHTSGHAPSVDFEGYGGNNSEHNVRNNNRSSRNGRNAKFDRTQNINQRKNANAQRSAPPNNTNTQGNGGNFRSNQNNGHRVPRSTVGGPRGNSSQPSDMAAVYASLKTTANPFATFTPPVVDSTSGSISSEQSKQLGIPSSSPGSSSSGDSKTELK